MATQAVQFELLMCCHKLTAPQTLGKKGQVLAFCYVSGCLQKNVTLQKPALVHHAKSCRPFKLFANKNYKRGNEPNQKQHLKEVQLKIPWHNRLCTEANDASA